MMNITLPEELAEQLEAIARRENRPVEQVVASMIEQYEPPDETETGPNWDMILGIGDESVTDIATGVRETLQDYFEKKYGRSD